MSEFSRQAHAVLDLSSRKKKAQKIERLLGLEARFQPLRILEIGTGSGGIAHYFGTHPTLHCEVTAVDVFDQRLVSDGYEFFLVEGTRLPFEDGSYDVILSNHVIEHVGDCSSQLAHLLEIRRMLKNDGIGYLAVPNRWMLIEPHYRLLFLSWLPRSWRSPYLRWSRKGAFYDCEPLQLSELDAMLTKAGLRFWHLEVEALRCLFDIEGTNGLLAKLASFVPNWILRTFRGVCPTLLCRLERA